MRKIYLVMTSGDYICNCFDNKVSAKEYVEKKKKTAFVNIYYIREEKLFSSLKESEDHYTEERKKLEKKLFCEE